jgi:hypothetical protein
LASSQATAQYQSMPKRFGVSKGLANGTNGIKRGDV